MSQRTYSCGLEAAMAVIGGKWKFMILFQLAQSPARFGDLRRRLGSISEKVLIQELKEMVANQIVCRKDFREVPPRVEYSLTTLGKSLAQTLVPLCNWGSQHMKRIGNLPTQSRAGPKTKAPRAVTGAGTVRS